MPKEIAVIFALLFIIFSAVGYITYEENNTLDVLISYLDANGKETGEHLIIKYANLKSDKYDKVLVYELENKTITYTGNYKMTIERK